jgi:hypothetical protein
MGDIGPILQDKAIVGPIFIQYTKFKERHIHIIAEKHDTNGNVDTQSESHVVEH